MLNILQYMRQPPQQTIIIQPQVSKVLRLRNLHFTCISSHLLKHRDVILLEIGLRAQKSNSGIDWMISGDQIEEQILESDRQCLPNKKMNTSFPAF